MPTKKRGSATARITGATFTFDSPEPPKPTSNSTQAEKPFQTITFVPPVPTLTAAQALALLADPVFQRDARAFLEELERTKTRYQAVSRDDRESELDCFLGQHVYPFRDKWHVYPPTKSELLRDPALTGKAAAILTGRWALIPVFPSTRASDVLRAVQRARQSVGRRHADAQTRHRAALAEWLLEEGYPRRDVFRAVWGRRPPRGARTTFEQEQAAMRDLYAEGLPYREAARRMARRQRKRTGDQRMFSAIRMAKARYARLLEEEARGTEAPAESDPLTSAMTMLLRETFCQDTVPEEALLAHLTALRDALFRE